jgi:hypothetical protein
MWDDIKKAITQRKYFPEKEKLLSPIQRLLGETNPDFRYVYNPEKNVSVDLDKPFGAGFIPGPSQEPIMSGYGEPIQQQMIEPEVMGATSGYGGAEPTEYPVGRDYWEDYLLNLEGANPEERKWLNDMAECESTYNPSAYNQSGATGLLQFMPRTWGWKGGGNINNPYEQIEKALQMYREGLAHHWSCNKIKGY